MIQRINLNSQAPQQKQPKPAFGMTPKQFKELSPKLHINFAVQRTPQGIQKVVATLCRSFKDQKGQKQIISLINNTSAPQTSPQFITGVAFAPNKTRTVYVDSKTLEIAECYRIDAAMNLIRKADCETVKAQVSSK